MEWLFTAHAAPQLQSYLLYKATALNGEIPGRSYRGVDNDYGPARRALALGTYRITGNKHWYSTESKQRSYGQVSEEAFDASAQPHARARFASTKGPRLCHFFVEQDRGRVTHHQKSVRPSRNIL